MNIFQFFGTYALLGNELRFPERFILKTDADYGIVCTGFVRASSGGHLTIPFLGSETYYAVIRGHNRKIPYPVYLHQGDSPGILLQGMDALHDGLGYGIDVLGGGSSHWEATYFKKVRQTRITQAFFNTGGILANIPATAEVTTLYPDADGAIFQRIRGAYYTSGKNNSLIFGARDVSLHVEGPWTVTMFDGTEYSSGEHTYGDINRCFRGRFDDSIFDFPVYKQTAPAAGGHFVDIFYSTPFYGIGDTGQVGAFTELLFYEQNSAKLRFVLFDSRPYNNYISMFIAQPSAHTLPVFDRETLEYLGHQAGSTRSSLYGLSDSDDLFAHSDPLGLT